MLGRHATFAMGVSLATLQEQRRQRRAWLAAVFPRGEVFSPIAASALHAPESANPDVIKAPLLSNLHLASRRQLGGAAGAAGMAGAAGEVANALPLPASVLSEQLRAARSMRDAPFARAAVGGGSEPPPAAAGT